MGDGSITVFVLFCHSFDIFLVMMFDCSFDVFWGITKGCILFGFIIICNCYIFDSSTYSKQIPSCMRYHTRALYIIIAIRERISYDYIENWVIDDKKVSDKDIFGI